MREDVTCPYCGDIFTENFEYAGGGCWSHAVPNHCDRCGSFVSATKFEGSTPWNAQTGWQGPGAIEGPPDWIHDLAARMFALGVQHGIKNALRPEHAPLDSLAPALAFVSRSPTPTPESPPSAGGDTPC